MKSRCVEMKNQRMTVLTILLLTMVTIIACMIFGVTKAQAAPAENTYKYYTSIQIQKGDTLWNIASMYMTDEYESVNDYIEEICAINHIDHNDIHSGQYLTIPYYSDEYLE